MSRAAPGRPSQSCTPILLAGLGAALLALNVLGLLCQRRGSLTLFLAVAMAQGILYLVAVWLVWRAGGKTAILLTVVVFAAALRLSVLFLPPNLSTDVYRYVWDGRLQAAGFNPYKYVPAAEELRPLRDDAIYPQLSRREYARAIYPPLALMLFYATTRISESVIWMKATMVLLEIIAMLALARLLLWCGMPAQRVVIYAWHPLAIWEIAGSGHVDAAVVMMIALALLARRRNASLLTGLALAGAALVKLYPAVLFPTLYRKWDWKMPCAFLCAFFLLYLPYLRVGGGVLGFLPGMLQEEGFKNRWSGFFSALLRPLWPSANAGTYAYMALSAAVLLVLGLIFVFRRSVQQPEVPCGRDHDGNRLCAAAGAASAVVLPLAAAHAHPAPLSANHLSHPDGLPALRHAVGLVTGLAGAAQCHALFAICSAGAD